MARLPLDKKPQIQRAYVRYCELQKEMPSARQKDTFASWVKWGGLVLFVAALFRWEWPLFVGGAGLLAFIIGWAMKSDSSRRYRVLLDEEREIEKDMKTLGVIFTAYGDIAVYAGEIATGNLVSPLNDESYA